MCLLFQILIIPYQHLLNLADVHRMEVTLGIVRVDSVLIEESALLKFRLIELLANQYQLGFLEIDGVISIDRCETSLANLVLVTARHTAEVSHLLFERLIHDTEGEIALFVHKFLGVA